METLTDRFWAKVEKSDTCWLWTGAHQSDGYGTIYRNGTMQLAHRVSWYLEHGYMPEEHVLHECDIPACVNPSHLFLGTQRDNMRDAVRKGRKSRISQTDVDEIRRLVASGIKQKDVAKQFDISKQYVNGIVRGHNW